MENESPQRKSLNDMLGEDFMAAPVVKTKKVKKERPPKPPKQPKPPKVKKERAPKPPKQPKEKKEREKLSPKVITLIVVITLCIVGAVFAVVQATSHEDVTKATETEDSLKAKKENRSVNGHTLKENNYEAPSQKGIKKAIKKDMKYKDYEKLTDDKKWVIDSKYDLNDGLIGDVILASDAFMFIEHTNKKITTVTAFDSLTSIDKYVDEMLKAKAKK